MGKWLDKYKKDGVNMLSERTTNTVKLIEKSITDYQAGEPLSGMWFSVEDIAKKTCLQEKYISGHILELVRKNVLEPRKTNNRTIYRFKPTVAEKITPAVEWLDIDNNRGAKMGEPAVTISWSGLSYAINWNVAASSLYSYSPAQSAINVAIVDSGKKLWFQHSEGGGLTIVAGKNRNKKNPTYSVSSIKLMQKLKDIGVQMNYVYPVSFDQQTLTWEINLSEPICSASKNKVAGK